MGKSTRSRKLNLNQENYKLGGRTHCLARIGPIYFQKTKTKEDEEL